MTWIPPAGEEYLPPFLRKRAPRARRESLAAPKPKPKAPAEASTATRDDARDAIPRLLEPRPIVVPDGAHFMRIRDEQMDDYMRRRPLVDVTEEIAFHKDVWLAITQGDTRQDEISLSVYKKMKRTDSHVRACYSFLRSAVVQSGGEFYYDGEDEDHGEEMVAFLRRNFNTYLEGGMRKWLNNACKALRDGFSVTELILQDGRGEDAKRKVLRKLPVLDAERVTFFTDHHANLMGIAVSAYGKVGGYPIYFDFGGQTRLPPEKAIVWTVDGEDDNFYGEPLFRGIYKWWKFKDFLIKMWAIYQERHAMPFRTVTGANPNDLSEAERVVASIHQGRSVVHMHESVKVEQLDATAKTEMFKAAVSYCDEMIARGLFLALPMMNGEQKEFKSPTVNSRFAEVTSALRLQLQDLVNRQLVKPLIDINFGEQEVYPYFLMDPAQAVDASVLAQFIQSDILDPDTDGRWIREKIGAPPRAKDFKSMSERMQEMAPAPGDLVVPGRQPMKKKPGVGKGRPEAARGTAVQSR